MADPLASQVSLLLPFDSPSGMGSYADRSSYRHLVTAVGNAHPSRVKARIGTWAGRFDGSGDSFDIAHHPALVFGAQDFCVEAWVYPQAGGAQYQYLVGKYNAGNNTRSWAIRISDKRVFDALCSSNGTDTDIFLNTGVAVVNDRWYHLALSREGQVFRMFVDGVEMARVTSAAALLTESNPVCVGRDGLSYWWFSGFIDGLRITTGAARYTGNFTPPTTEFDWIDLPPAKRYQGLKRIGGYAELNRVQPWPVLHTVRLHRILPSPVPTPAIGRGVLIRNAVIPHRAGRSGCKLEGTVTIKGNPNNQAVSRPVRLYSQGSGLFLAQTQSDAQGLYRFEGLDPDQRYFVVAFDTQQWFRAVVADQLTPGVTT